MVAPSQKQQTDGRSREPRPALTIRRARDYKSLAQAFRRGAMSESDNPVRAAAARKNRIAQRLRIV